MSSENLPELAKKIRCGVSLDAIGDSVSGMRQAKTGGLIIEVRGDSSKVEAVRNEISRSAGSEVEVKTLQQKSLLEIRDLDQWTISEEVVDAVATATGVGREAIKVMSVRKRFDGTKTALVLVPTTSLRNVLASGRIRIGMVSCRARVSDQKTRCFRCLSFGHLSKACDEPDRALCFRRCGVAGHKAAGCSAPLAAAQEFAKLVGANVENQQ